MKLRNVWSLAIQRDCAHSVSPGGGARIIVTMELHLAQCETQQYQCRINCEKNSKLPV